MKKKLYVAILLIGSGVLLPGMETGGAAENMIKTSSEKMFTEIVDVENYLEQYAQLVTMLNMEPTEHWQFTDADSYEKDQFYLEMSGDMFSMKNEGAQYIWLFGTKLGEPIAEVNDSLLKIGWTEHYKDENLYDYISIINDKKYVLSVYYDTDGTVVSWYLNNWPQGEEVANDFKRLERDRQLEEDGQSEEWKQAYLDYIDNIHDKVGMSSTETLFMITELYKLVDINGDEIPELYVNTGSTAGGDYLCTYVDGSVIEQYMWNYGFSYIEGENLFRDSGGHMDVYYDKIYGIQDGQFVLKASGEYGAEDNTSVKIDENGNPIYNYKWNNKEVASESEYMELLEQSYDIGRSVSPFDGTSYDDDAARYVGNGICDYNEIVEAVIAYGEEEKNPVDDKKTKEQEKEDKEDEIKTPQETKQSTPAPAAQEQEQSQPAPATQEQPQAAGAASSEYILPDSNTRYLSDSEAAALGAEKLQLAINEIYARHGRVFTNADNSAYFSSKSWYQPVQGKTDAQIEAEFNEYEKANVDLMNKYR